MIRRILVGMALVALLLLGGSFISKKIAEPPHTVDTPAFVATMGRHLWVITLNQKYFTPETKSVSLTYNNALYGIFLPTDKIHLPVLPLPKKLILTSLDADGNPIMRKTFTLRSPKK
jgi:hypothetical protein